MFNEKSFNEKFLLTRKYYDFARAINCTRKLTCVCACACTCDRTRLREQYASSEYHKAFSMDSINQITAILNATMEFILSTKRSDEPLFKSF